MARPSAKKSTLQQQMDSYFPNPSKLKMMRDEDLNKKKKKKPGATNNPRRTG